MNLHDAGLAAAIGVIEGLTEFLPVSSTGHILLADHFLGFGSPGGAFEIVIQLGAILAIVVLYFARLWQIAINIPQSAAARRFVGALLLAFLPSVLVGVALHDFIKKVLFASPHLIAVTLILGGFAILWIEKRSKRVVVESAETMPLRTAFWIGCCQCLAMVPGVSRSGATIMGAMLLGVERKAAAEFSFFLSLPTMFGATAYDLYKNRAALNVDDMGLIGIGFVCAFISALVVVRLFIGFISKHGFVPFAWYRIGLGALVIAALALGL